MIPEHDKEALRVSPLSAPAVLGRWGLVCNKIITNDHSPLCYELQEMCISRGDSSYLQIDRNRGRDGVGDRDKDR